LPWLKPGGKVIGMKGPEGKNELRAAEPILKQYRFSDPTVFSYELPFSKAERQILIISLNH